ncbi:MAG: hypothetical protein ACOZQL_00775 [Myxococcota bacterium]
MARREPPQSAAVRLLKSLPKLTPLLREAHDALWTDGQCDAWGRKAKPADVLAQAEDWLKVAHTALAGEAAEDVPYTRLRLAWLAEQTVALDRALAGDIPRALAEAQDARDEKFDEARRVQARLASRMSLLVGGAEERGAALAIANHGHKTVEQVVSGLSALSALLSTWRKEPGLVVLADELGLDLTLLRHATKVHDELEDAVLEVTSAAEQRKDTQPVGRLAGRVLRELAALHRAFSAAHDAGLKAPRLKVRAALKNLFG